MARRIDAPALVVPVRQAGVPAYRWLCAALRAAILDGRLRPGVRLPATRDLARRFGVARGTIVSAFEQMKSEGYLTARTGSGTYVSAVLPDALLEVARPAHAARTAPTPRRRHLSQFAKRVRPFVTGAARARAFRANQPALDLFPTALWAQVAGRRLRRATVDLLRGCDALGYVPLRQAVADYLNSARAVVCAPQQVTIVSGVQEALDLVSRLLLNPGDRVAIENPGYSGARLLFDALGAKVCGLALDEEGAELPNARLGSVRFVYLTPAHQFPVGVSMSLPRRLAFIEWARNAGALIFEDDYDSEFRYAGAPVPSMQGLDRHGVVLFAGSFSKVLFPSIRLGYLVVPADLVDRVAAIKSVVTRHAPLVDQAVLADFIAEGHFGRHVRRMREVYAGRLAALLESARDSLGGLIDVAEVEAGLQTAAWLPHGLSGEAVAAAAAERNVEVIPLSRYYRGTLRRDGLVLGFAAVDTPEIQRGARDLAAAIDRCRRRR